MSDNHLHETPEEGHDKIHDKHEHHDEHHSDHEHDEQHEVHHEQHDVHHEHHDRHHEHHKDHHDKHHDIILNDGSAGNKYRIVNFKTEDERTRGKIETLGVTADSAVRVISNTGAGLILKVKGSRLAISHELAKQILVRG